MYNIFDAYLIGLALAGGITSFLTPCNLVSLPSFISFVGVEGKNAKHGFLLSLSYGAGFCLVFSLIGSALLFVPGFILTQVRLRVVGGIIVVILGVLLALGVFKRAPRSFSSNAQDESLCSNVDGSGETDEVAPTIQTPKTSVPMQVTATPLRPSMSRAFVLGVGLGTSGLACAGPILVSIITTLLTETDVGMGAICFAFYALGLILPFFVIGAGMGKISEVFLLKLIRYSKYIQRGLGLVLIILGVIFLWDALVILGWV